MEKYYIIAGYGKYKYPKKVNLKKAKECQEKGKEVYDSQEKAREKIARDKK